MAFPPGVTVKDYTWAGSHGYLNPKRGAEPARFKTIIQIVSGSPDAVIGSRRPAANRRTPEPEPDPRSARQHPACSRSRRPCRGTRATSRPSRFAAAIVAHLLRQLHRAELRSAHRAEVRHLGAVGRQRRVVVRARGDRIERQVELILPAELEPRLRQRIVPCLRARMPLGQIGGVRRDLVGDDARLDVVAVGQAEVLLRRDVAEHRRAVPADHAPRRSPR